MVTRGFKWSVGDGYKALIIPWSLVRVQLGPPYFNELRAFPKSKIGDVSTKRQQVTYFALKELGNSR